MIQNDLSEFLKSIRWNKENPEEDEMNDSFNIFKILGIESKEVLACRFLGALLTPNGNHGLGDKPLKNFLKTVCLDEVDVYSNATVVLEDPTDNRRRVDITIYNNDKIYPIEVKIWADDQEAQLNDYYKYYFGDKNTGKIYYLTPNGKEPSEKSLNGLPKEYVSICSFSEHIKNWLEEIKECTKESSYIFNLISQYQGVITEMTKTVNDQNTILESVGIISADEINTIDKNKLHSLIRILKANGDKNGYLQKEIQRYYLRKRLVFDKEKYDLINSSDSEHSKALLKIMEKENKADIAWICVDTNLYIACDELSTIPLGWAANNWTYIKPSGFNGKTFQLNDCINIINEEERRLGDIDITGIIGVIINNR